MLNSPAQCLVLSKSLLPFLGPWRFPPNTYLLFLKRDLHRMPSTTASLPLGTAFLAPKAFSPGIIALDTSLKDVPESDRCA